MTVPREFVIKKKKTKRKITLTSQQRMNSLSLQAAVLEAHGGVFATPVHIEQFHGNSLYIRATFSMKGFHINLYLGLGRDEIHKKIKNKK